MPMRLVLCFSVALLGASALAQQVQPAPPAQPVMPSPVDAREEAATDALNQKIQQNAIANEAMSADRQRQYDMDRAAFRAAAEVRREKIISDSVVYERQQRAFADAMAAWRAQVRACNQGDRMACNKPTPMPAEYYRY